MITDPIWLSRLFYAPRLVPPGVPIDQLPGVDVVTVTHNHFDHMDLFSLVELSRLYQPQFVVPKGNASFLRQSGLREVIELDWWETTKVRDLELTLVPAQHWSQRGAVDTNLALWGGYIYRGTEGCAYHAGDTAFEAEVFKKIGERFDIDWAMMPIAAYEPEWFLRNQHINPEDSISAFELLRAKIFVAMHYGTYNLTDEPLGEPMERAVASWKSRYPMERFWALDVGETRRLITKG